MNQLAARRSRLAALGVLALAVAGCGADTTDAVGENTAQACEDLTAYTAALRDLVETLGPDATIEQVQAAQDQAEEDEQALAESIADVSDDRTDEISRSWDALVTAFGDIDDDATLDEAADSLRTEAQGVVAAVTSVGEDLDCG